jgi:flagellar hook-associated protein 1 FlgK
MSLTGALSIAAGGLANVNRQLGVVAQNVTNAGTPGYLTEVATQSSLSTGDQPMGVAAGPARREVDTALQASLFAQNGVVAGLQTTQSALQQIDGVQGTPGQPGDLTGLVGALGNAFSSLENDPSNQAQQSRLVNAASALTGQINALANAVGAGRQAAQNSILAEVGQINSTLGTIGSLSDQIMAARAAGRSTADYENQRDNALSSLSSLIGVRSLEQPDGDLLITTTGGLALPTRGNTGQLATSAVTVGASSSYPGGGIPAITLNGVDVTASLGGGQLGANITLRDQTLPGYQAQLDEFAETLSNRFAQQGLALFTDPAGNVPVATPPPTQSGYIGYASIIQVNPAVATQPSLVRDRTNTIAGSPTGASAFTPNPPGGPLGFNTLIQARAELQPRFRGAGGRGAAAAVRHRPWPLRHALRPLCRAARPRRLRHRPDRRPGQRQQQCHRTARHRAGGADHALRQPLQRGWREPRSADVEHGRAAERLRCQRQGDRCRAVHVGAAVTDVGMR